MKNVKNKVDLRCRLLQNIRTCLLEHKEETKCVTGRKKMEKKEQLAEFWAISSRAYERTTEVIFLTSHF